jgi:hypothetical protein
MKGYTNMIPQPPEIATTPQMRNIPQVAKSLLSPPRGPSLGNTTVLASTRVNIDVQNAKKEEARKETEKTLSSINRRYKLQEYAQTLHPDTRLSACLKVFGFNSEFVDVHYSKEKNHAHYRGLAHCDNVWTCPVCSGRITSERALEVRQGYSYAIDSLGYRVVMVTYTLSHHKFDSLESSVEAIRQARKKMRSGRSWQSFKKNYAYVGSIASFEVTYNETNGWHPHVHELMFLNPRMTSHDIDYDTPDETLEKWLKDELSEAWILSLEKVGRSASLERGIDVTATSEQIGEYIAKYGHLPEGITWDASLELAKGGIKNQPEDGSKSLSVWSILALGFSDDLTADEKNVYRALWYEYANVFKGQKQMFWVRGLKELLLVEEEPEDATEDDSVVVVKLGRNIWNWICAEKLRATLLNECIKSGGDSPTVNAWLKRERVTRHLAKRIANRGNSNANI